VVIFDENRDHLRCSLRLLQHASVLLLVYLRLLSLVIGVVFDRPLVVIFVVSRREIESLTEDISRIFVILVHS
jgi:hypothetical protein